MLISSMVVDTRVIVTMVTTLMEPSAKISTNARMAMNVMLTRELAPMHLDLTLAVVKMPAGNSMPMESRVTISMNVPA